MNELFMRLLLQHGSRYAADDASEEQDSTKQSIGSVTLAWRIAIPVRFMSVILMAEDHDQPGDERYTPHAD